MKHFFTPILKNLEKKELSYIQNKKYLKAILITVVFNLIISIIPTLLTLTIFSIVKIYNAYCNYGINNLLNHLKIKYHLFIISIGFIIIYICYLLLLFILKITLDKNFCYTSFLLKFNNIFNLYSEERRTFKFYKKFGFNILVYIISLLALLFIFSVFYGLFFKASPNWNNVSSTCTIVIIAILLFLSIYLMPEENDKQKYSKNYAKFFLWFLGLGLSIYSLYCRSSYGNLEIISLSLPILITVERMYKAYKDLEVTYDKVSNDEVKTTFKSKRKLRRLQKGFSKTDRTVK